MKSKLLIRADDLITRPDDVITRPTIGLAWLWWGSISSDLFSVPFICTDCALFIPRIAPAFSVTGDSLREFTG